jgi:DNA-binding IclR family transcriptional regulator
MMEVAGVSNWTFITNHGAVLAVIGQQQQITAREIAAKIGITERSVQRIVIDLETEGYIRKRRDGRLNVYEVDHMLPLRHVARGDAIVRDLLNVLKSGTALEE